MRAAFSIAALTLFAAPAAATAQNDPRLGLPIDCTLGADCYIQQLVDRDPGPGTSDYQCGQLTYDGHKGIDFAIPTLSDMRRGVDVLASVSGVVTGVRDGVPDVVYSAANASAVANRECGNGVVLRHPNGWETQYCHLKSGSIAVAKGQKVTRGTILGQVGLSGQTQFPHVQLSVRQNGNIIDPFDTTAMPSCGENSANLWDTDIEYVPGGLILAGFATGVPDYDTVKDGTAALSEISPDASGLVLFGFGFGGRMGDVMELQIDGPKGVLFTQSVTLKKNQAQFYRAGGKRRTAPRWPAGTYTGTVRITRADAELDRQEVQITIR